MAYLFSDIRKMEWQTLYLNMTPIATPCKKTSGHADLRILVTYPVLNHGASSTDAGRARPCKRGGGGVGDTSV